MVAGVEPDAGGNGGETPYLRKHQVAVALDVAVVPQRHVVEHTALPHLRPVPEAGRIQAGRRMHLGFGRERCHRWLEQFADSAYVAGYTVMPADCQASQVTIPGIKDGRQIIHWAFNAKKGDISEIFEIGGRYVVAAVEKIAKEGYRPMEDLETMLTSSVRRDKKAAIIAEQLAAANATTIEAYATAMNASVDTAKYVSLMSPSIQGMGYEPVVAGAATALEVGKVSAPITGNRGVYVLQVVNENPVARPYDEASEMVRLQQQYTSATNQFLEVLKDKADIENTLVRFF